MILFFKINLPYNTLKAVILAASPSRRLSPFIEHRTKPMIRVAGGPILEYTLKSLHQAGFREIMMVVNHEQEGFGPTLDRVIT